MDRLVFKVNGSDYLYSSKLRSIYQINSNINIDNFEEENITSISSNEGKPIRNNKRLSQLQFVSTQVCNMKCRYCYASSGTYYKTENNIISFEDYKKVLLIILEYFPLGIDKISFFGGEPLIGFNEIKQFVEFAVQYISKCNLDLPQFGMITNGTLINKEISEFIYRYNIGVTVSLDGVKKINDINRIMKNNSGSFDKIVKGIKALKVTNPNINIAVESTLAKNNLQDMDINSYIRFVQILSNLGVTTFALIPEFNNEDIFKEKDYEKIELLYKQIVDHTFSILTSLNKNLCLPLDVIATLNALVNEVVSRDCAAGYGITISADLKVYGCQLLLMDKSHEIFHILEPYCLKKYFNSDFVNELKKANRFMVERCNTCFAKNVCGVWCRGINKVAYGTMYATNDIRCFVQRTIFKQILHQLISHSTSNVASNRISQNLKKVVSTMREF
jgi:uncharacterized protein